MNPATNSTAPRTRRSVLGNFVRSSIGAKWVMAITGVLFLLWLIGHLVGNLQIFAGAQILNDYAAFLRANPTLLWLVRIGLVVVVVLHVLAGIRLATLNRQARPERYEGYRFRKASWASRSMIWTGVIILAFVLFHLAHFTWGWIFPSYFQLVDGKGQHDVGGMLVRSFSHPWMAAIYMVAMVAVGMHLSHAIWSSMQTMGLYGRRFTPRALRIGRWIGILIALGFFFIPLAVLFGIVRIS